MTNYTNNETIVPSGEKYLEETIYFAVEGISLTLVGIIGLFGNIIILSVLRRPTLKCGRQVRTILNLNRD